MKNLNIGITCYPTYGGSGVIASEIGMAMAARGHKIHFICSDVPRRLDRLMENIYFHEVVVQDYPLFSAPPYDLALTSKMTEVATYEELDIFHVHYAVPHATSAFLAKSILGPKAPKVITTLHGTDITLVGNDRSYLPVTRFSIQQSDGVTTPSQYLKLATYDKLNIPSSTNITVIPNFVDEKLYAPAQQKNPKDLKRFFGCSESKEKVITHTSNFRPVKRIGDVIKVFAIVAKEISSHLVLVGDGPERSSAEQLVWDLGLHQRVCFLGKQESIVPILQLSDVFLLPSETESFGLAALEAMSCGVPVVASEVGGIPEVVTHGKTGYLSKVGNIEVMAAHVLELLKSDTKRSELGKNARLHVEQNFTLEQMATRYEEYYREILSR
ncbi:N-acetyl-alpha-D-glucosaminyl L-malate synthase BshA [bacterium]|nr:N-acetyl-alpha-D-glucosaminyl L-malate synthase BshA [bacterium]